MASSQSSDLERVREEKKVKVGGIVLAKIAAWLPVTECRVESMKDFGGEPRSEAALSSVRLMYEVEVRPTGADTTYMVPGYDVHGVVS